MKLLTLNFLTCARKTCKGAAAAFPLHPREAELEQIEMDLNVAFLQNMIRRLDWPAIQTIANELGLPQLPDQIPDESALTTISSKSQSIPTEAMTTAAETDKTSSNENDNDDDKDDNGDEEEERQPTQILKDLHVLLMEMSIVSGKLACGNCGHEYEVKEGIANFLLPSHMV